MVFIELPAFTDQKLFDDEGLRALQSTLLLDPYAGDVIQGGRGLRKMRVALPGRGKRGGARVIYYFWSTNDICYLVFAYPKNAQENLTAAQVKILSKLMHEALENE
jgi:hypothetical protein